VYALACVLFECLTGAPPFHRPSEVAVLNAHLHDAPPGLPSELPSGLEVVIAKALSKSPLDRYESCGELVAAARAAAAERHVHRRRLVLSVALLLLVAAVGAAAALGIRELVTSSSPAPPPPPPTRAATPQLDHLLLRSEDGRTLNDVAYALIGAHAYRRALPFARKAVAVVDPGTVTQGYATYNLGYVLLKLGRCSESLTYLRRALRLEDASQDRYINPRIAEAKRCARG
jgi:tetratricopeptide (TPR) repeat protein